MRATIAGALSGALGAASAQGLEVALSRSGLALGDLLAVLLVAAAVGATVVGAGALCLALALRGRELDVELRTRLCVFAAAATFAALVGLGCARWVGSRFELEAQGPLLRGSALLLPLFALGFGLSCARVGAALRLPAPPPWAALLALVAAGALLVRVYPQPRVPQRTPARAPKGSVVFIVLDTTRADAFAAYGSRAGATPYFDRLAREGSVYEELISESPWTVPSHATMFTGLPPRTHDCWLGGRRWLRDELVTVAERFARAGHDTAAFVGNGYLTLTNLLQGFAKRESLSRPYDALTLTWLMRYTGLGFPRYIDRGASEAVSEIDAWLAARRPDKPFFLFLNLFEAHDPYLSPIADRELPTGAGMLDAMRALRDFDDQHWHALRRDAGRQPDVVRALYRAGIRYQDRMLRAIVERIGRHYRLDELALVVTSDHGENLGEGGRWGHEFALNDALVRLPLVIRAPGRLPGGERVKGAFSSVDLASTLLDLGGFDQRFGEGQSLVSAPQPPAATFSEVFPYYFSMNHLRVDTRQDLGDFRWPMSAVRAQGHKLVVWHGGPTRLYDLASDPREERDLAAERPVVLRALQGELQAWRAAHPQKSAADAPAVAPRPMDAETARKLHTLGYL